MKDTRWVRCRNSGKRMKPGENTDCAMATVACHGDIVMGAPPKEQIRVIHLVGEQC